MIFAGNEGISPDHIAGVTNFAADDVREGIRDLARRSLVERRGGIDASNYGIHPLTSTFLQNHTRDAAGGIRDLISRFAASNIHYWKEYIRSSKAYEIFRSNPENLRLAVQFAFEYGENMEATWLLLKLHSSILSNRQVSQWIDLFRRGFGIRKFYK